jgi:hypothetical protein
MNDQDKMKSALKRIVMPELRRQGFKGSFPHFRRISTRVDLLTIQFDRNGGGFVLEVAESREITGFTTHWGKHIPAEKLTAWDLHPDHRKRLQPKQGSGTDCWFRYDGLLTDCDTVAYKALEIINKHNWGTELSVGDDGKPVAHL